MIMRALLVALCVAVSSAAMAAEPLNIVEDGRSSYSIVLSAEASASERHGAEELRAHFKQMSAVDLPVVTDAQALPAAAILVGRSKYTDAMGILIDEKKLGPDGFVLKTTGKHVVVAGSRVRGTMYGCTAMLEKLGVRWFTPKVTHVPARTTVAVPALDEQQTPAFEYREAYFTEALDKAWAPRMRFNGNFAGVDASRGGKITYQPFVHSFDELVPRSLFASHPEYFPVIKGKRTDGYVQRCLSNPEVLKLSIAKVKEWIKQVPQATIYTVSQNDTYNFCTCERCGEIVKRHGGVQSGMYLWFVNQVAEAIEKEHPDKLIDTLAYQFTEQPPTGITPRKNVRIRLCPISVCEAHPYEKCSAPPNKAFVQNLAAWAKITDTLYIWHYNTNFSNYLMPFPDFDEFPADTRLYKRSGVKGIFFQGAYGPGGGGSDAELRSYVMGKLLWDPSVDSDALVNEWLAGVYGPAAKPMRGWFDLLHAKARPPEQHFFIYSPPTVHYLSADVVAQGDKLFDEAEKLVAGNAVAGEYVAKARLGLRYVKLMQNKKTGPELESFVADVKKFGIQQLREGQAVEVWEQAYLKGAK
jgi:hypothetical protein